MRPPLSALLLPLILALICPVGTPPAASAQDAALCDAILRDSLPLVKSALRHGANVDARDAQGTTPLMLTNDPAIMRLLLDHGANVDSRDNQGQTALLNAITFSREPAVIFLVKHGADVHVTDRNGTTALMAASASNYNEALILLLLSKGLRVNATNRHGQTALMYAASSGDAKAVRLLMTRGADLNVRDKEGETALFQAALVDETTTAQLLVTSGADVNLANTRGDTPLKMTLAWEDVRLAGLVQMLLDHRANVNAQDRDGDTILNEAVTSAPPEVIRALLAAGAQVDARNKSGQGALMNAAAYGEKDAVRLLLERHADTELTDRNGATAFFYAATDHYGLALLKADIQVNMPGAKIGTTPETVSGESSLPVVRLLLAHGANVNARDSLGKTVLFYASLEKHPKLIAALEQAGALK